MVNSDTDFPQDWRLPEPVDDSELPGQRVNNDTYVV